MKDTWFETKKGHRFIGYLMFDVIYSDKINITKNKIEIFTENNRNYKKFQYPTLYDLCQNKTIIMKKSYKEYRMKLGFSTILSDDRIEKIIKTFHKKGFNITKEAIWHNYIAWQGDYKSGYRDDNNNYHLFTPCGCNPLSFTATSLCNESTDWQITYMC